MAFTYEQTTGAGSGLVTTVPIPTRASGTPAAGSITIAIVVLDHASTTPTTTPGNWTEMGFDTTNAAGMVWVGYARDALGATENLVLSNACRWVAHVFYISAGHSTTVAPAHAFASATDANPDPPNVAHPDTSGDALGICACADVDGSSTTATNVTATTTDNTYTATDSGGAGGVHVSITSEAVELSSVSAWNPAVATSGLTGSIAHTDVTVLLAAAAASTGLPLIYHHHII